MINIGQYIETAINWLTNNFATFFDTLSIGIGSFIDSFQHVLYGIPFYITIAVLAILAWMKSGKGTAVFTVLGLYGIVLCLVMNARNMGETELRPTFLRGAGTALLLVWSVLSLAGISGFIYFQF